MGKELNTKKLVDTTFWLKPWLKLISFGYTFFHLAKVLATTCSEPELALIGNNKSRIAYIFFFRARAYLHVV